MKIAFVSQPIDTVLPPRQNSVGACTFWSARPLAKSSQVLVYGLQDANPDLTGAATEYGIDFRLFPSTRLDRSLFNARRRYGKLFGSRSPISTSRWMFPDYGLRVAKDLQQEKCDVIHLQHCSQYIPVIRAHNPDAKIVLHLHGEWFSQTNPLTLTSRLEQVDLITSVGNHITEKTKRTFPRFASRCETTYNGIDPQEFARAVNHSATRQSGVRRILYSGAVSPHKGVHVLLQSFVEVVRRFPAVEVDIVGPIGNYPIEENFDLRDDQDLIKTIERFYETGAWSYIRSKLPKKSSKQQSYLRYLNELLPPDVANKVRFRGFVTRKELVEAYYSADIFAFAPIWNEGFGLPPVEAMAAGLPVVTTHSGTLPETVVHGSTGFVVEKNNVEQLARALLMLLENDDLRESMGRAGRQRMLQQFSWDAIAHGMQARYQRLCQHTMKAA